MIYFAYGSNMLRRRLVERVGEVEDLGVARLDNYCLAFDKDGRDHSGKCTIFPGEDSVWGVLFGMDPSQQHILDDFEGPDYGVHDINVVQEDMYTGPRVVTAFAYMAHEYRRNPAHRPWGWYRDLVLAGALQNDLPGEYVARLRETDFLPDPDADRHQRNADILRAAGIPPSSESWRS